MPGGRLRCEYLRSTFKFKTAGKTVRYLTCLASLAAATAWNHDDYVHSSGPEEIPNPLATGQGWEDAFAKAADFVSELTLEEKVALVSGTQGPCVGKIAPIDRLNFTGLCIQNGPLALEQGTYTSVFGAGLTVAASWDRSIAYTRGYQLAEEFRGKGSQVILGPVAGPLGRHAYGGRNWEGFSPDPYLTGELFTESIVGMQDVGVQACAKHYIGNEQETQRNPSTNDDGKTIESVSANIDDRTLHELYLWPFQQAVKAGVASVMCSYNRINQTYGFQNSKTQNGILKGELGFQGYVMSDWGATHSTGLAVNAGEDMDMGGTPQFGEWFHQNLTDNVNNGSVSIDRIDDMAKRVLTPYFHLKQDEGFPATDPSSIDTNSIIFSGPDEYKYNFTYGDVANVDVRGNHKQSIREAGAAGTVLLKNVNSTLPLTKSKHVGIFGNDAGDFTNGMSYWYFNGPGNYEYGVLATGGGSGSGLFTYVVSPLEAIKQRVAYQDGALIPYVLNNSAIIEQDSPYLAALQPQPPEVCLVFVKSCATQGEDRTTLGFEWQGDEVVEKVASFCPNTVVVTHSGGVNTMSWADHPNITAILAAHLPGQEAGNSIVDVLWGEVEPSGRLPYTIAKKASDYDYAPITNSTELLNTENPLAWQSDFTDKTLIDYRHFDYYNTSVQYEFGYGLSYTTFSLAGNLNVTAAKNASRTATPPQAAIVPGGNPHLWDVLYTVQTTVTNTGSRAGSAVPQLYISLPHHEGPEPKNVLRGFEKVKLDAGESKVVSFELNRRDLSYWDVVTQQWTIGSGEVVARVGFSSRDFKAKASFVPLESA